MATSATHLGSSTGGPRRPDLHLVPAIPDAFRQRLLARVAVSGDRDQLAVTTPFTEGLIGQVPSATAEDVANAVDRARAAQKAWRRTSFEDRAAIMMRFHDLVFERQEEGLDLIQLESGKVRAHAFEEIADSAIVAHYYARTAERLLKPRKRLGALPLVTRTEEVRHPKGVVGFIAPWNYPLSMAITDAIPALMAGNACVIKPAQQTPFTALWAADLMYQAGLPADLIQIVTGRGSVIGTPMIEQCDFITFTGSTEVGRTIAAQAGERLIGCALELGGKNPMIVLDDADVDKAVDGALTGCFSSAGQLCISIERLFVHESVVEEFTDKLVAEVSKLKLSGDLAWGGEVGSLASRSQLDTVTRHVEDALAKGATVLTGAEPRPDVGPLFYAPTLLTDVTPDMELYAEETFGPVVAVYPYRDIEDAIEQANASRYGLNASIWTTDGQRGRDIAARIECGTVNINEAYAAAWASVDAPMGGFKDSGLGRRHGREGIYKYTEVQNIAHQRLMPVADPPFVNDELAAKILTTAVRVISRFRRMRVQ